ncbi:MAG: TetR/AcrR family transcriptional regulator [Fidelibacterota bacterium]|nr:MAG: TetR/AcrR family transcriptional regulator [Candidatus Neomarinimicrobiota bacterium]
MPPTTKIIRKQVVEAAFSIVRDQGLDALSARSVADQLHCSTAPVYSQFHNMEALRFAVAHKILALMEEYDTAEYTDRTFLNMGIGTVLFARDYPHLFRAIHLDTSQFNDLITEYLGRLVDMMRREKRFSDLLGTARADLLEKMWIYTHGMATLVTTGYFHDVTRESITRSLEEVGGIVIAAALEKHANGA